MIDKGTPLVQVIPFRRDDAGIKADIRAETSEEAASRNVVYRNTIAGPGWYRKIARAAR
ncbi:hypothetical protein D3C72_2558440 [compost metagenome]